MSKKISKEFLEELVVKYNSTSEISKATGFNVYKIRYHLNKYNLKTKNWIARIENKSFSPGDCANCKTKLPLRRAAEIKKVKNSFCSKSCAATFNNKLKGKKNKSFICLNCKKSFISNKSKERKYCSRFCFGIHKSEEKFLNGSSGLSNIRTAFLRRNEYKCSVCYISEWNNNSIVLELDHIDGNSLNNTLENIRLLCPNCHSQTSTYRAKNKGRGNYKRREWYNKNKSKWQLKSNN